MSYRIEHANITVSDIKGMVRFLKTAFPDFIIRHEGVKAEGRSWVHVGTDEIYFALEESAETAKNQRSPYAETPGMNHIAFEVDNVDVIKERLEKAGFRDSTVDNNHPYRKRIYFFDPEGNDWEFIEYYSDDPKQKNDYSGPD